MSIPATLDLQQILPAGSCTCTPIVDESISVPPLFAKGLNLARPLNEKSLCCAQQDRSFQC